jgi:ribosomal protein L7/L12
VSTKLEDFLDLLPDGRSRDEVLAQMRDSGLTIVEAIKASMKLFDVGLSEAKSLVASHSSWVETARAAEPLHNELMEAFRESELQKRSG